MKYLQARGRLMRASTRRRGRRDSEEKKLYKKQRQRQQELYQKVVEMARQGLGGPHLLVSSGRPGPIMSPHHDAASAFPVRAWQICERNPKYQIRFCGRGSLVERRTMSQRFGWWGAAPR